MVTAYLAINALVYLLFAVWCLVKPESTARFSGLQFLNGSGKSEYLTIYTGLQAGLGSFFLFAAMNEELHAMAVLFSVFLYGGIFLVRFSSLVTIRNIQKGTYIIALMELLLTAGALFSYLSLN